MHKGIVLITINLILAGSALAESNWRYHGKVCGWDETCMKAQAHAQNLWTSRDWDPFFATGCRQAHIKTYAKDYVSAVNCVLALQKEKQENKAIQDQVARDRAEKRQEEKKERYIGRGGKVLSGGKMVSY